MDEADNLKFRKIEPFGFEVELTSPDLPAAQAEALRRHYRKDGLLVVRGLRLSHPEQIAFCRNFGPVHESPNENFIVSNVEADGLLGQRELLNAPIFANLFESDDGKSYNLIWSRARISNGN